MNVCAFMSSLCIIPTTNTIKTHNLAPVLSAILNSPSTHQTYFQASVASSKKKKKV